MTDPTTVTIAAVNADSTPAAFAQVIARLIHGGAGGTINDVAIVDEVAVRLDEDGEGTVALYPNDVIVPAGTYWSLTVKGSTPTVVRLLDVPESATPVLWTDPAYLLEDPSPPTVLPAPTSGVAFQVPRVNSTGDTYELRTLVPADISELDAALPVQVGFFLEDTDMTGGAFTNLVPLGTDGGFPRSYAVGESMLVTEGDDVGVWTITATGPCTPGTALAPGQIIVATAGGTGAMATATSDNGTTVSGVAVKADQGTVEVQVEDAFAAATTDATAPKFELCTDFGDTYDDHVWSSPSAGLTLTTGLWLRGVVNIQPWDDPAPDSETFVYSEIFTVTHDGDGVIDAIEWAVRRTWRPDPGRWVHNLFFQSKRVGSATDDYNLIADEWEMPEGVDLEVAAWLTFNADGQSVGRLLRRTYLTHPDVVLEGVGWSVLTEFVTDPFTIDFSGGEPCLIGSNLGRLHVPFVTAADEPGGTPLFSPTAVGALAEGGTSAFVDAAGKTWTPEAGAVASEVTSGGGAVDSVNGDTGVVVLTAADVGAAPTSHTHAASALTSGTIDIARIPTGTTGTTVPLGNDARFTDARTPTSHVHAAADITSGTIAAARLPTFPWPRRQTIYYAVHKPMSFTTWTPTSGSFIGGGFASGTNANSESWTYGLSLDAGTYTVRSVARRAAQGPIISFALDGGVGTIGTHDTYNGSTAGDNAVDLSTTLVIPTAGYYTLTITNATRNGSNVTGWVMTPQVFDLYRTGP